MISYIFFVVIGGCWASRNHPIDKKKEARVITFQCWPKWFSNPLKEGNKQGIASFLHKFFYNSSVIVYYKCQNAVISSNLSVMEKIEKEGRERERERVRESERETYYPLNQYSVLCNSCKWNFFDVYICLYYIYTHIYTHVFSFILVSFSFLIGSVFTCYW